MLLIIRFLSCSSKTSCCSYIIKHLKQYIIFVTSGVLAYIYNLFHWGESLLGDSLHCLNLYSGTQITSNPLPLYSLGKAACKPAGRGWAKVNTELAFSSATCVPLLIAHSTAWQWSSHRSHYTKVPDTSTLPLTLPPGCFSPSTNSLQDKTWVCFRECSSLKNASKQQHG